MATQTSTRLDPAIFRLPIDRIRQGYYSDAYFVYTKELLEAEGHHPRVTMQVFQKQESVLGGIDEAIAVLKLCSGREEDGVWVSAWNELEVYALREGDQIVLHRSRPLVGPGRAQGDRPHHRRLAPRPSAAAAPSPRRWPQR